MRPPTNDPTIPMPIVAGIDMGSRPGSARRASAPTIRPLMASRMRKVIMGLRLPRAITDHPPMGATLVTQGGTGEERWELVRRAAHPALGAHVRGYAGYRERTPGPTRRLEV